MGMYDGLKRVENKPKQPESGQKPLDLDYILQDSLRQYEQRVAATRSQQRSEQAEKIMSLAVPTLEGLVAEVYLDEGLGNFDEKVTKVLASNDKYKNALAGIIVAMKANNQTEIQFDGGTFKLEGGKWVLSATGE